MLKVHLKNLNIDKDKNNANRKIKSDEIADDEDSEKW